MWHDFFQEPVEADAVRLPGPGADQRRIAIDAARLYQLLGTAWAVAVTSGSTAERSSLWRRRVRRGLPAASVKTKRAPAAEPPSISLRSNRARGKNSRRLEATVCGGGIFRSRTMFDIVRDKGSRDGSANRLFERRRRTARGIEDIAVESDRRASDLLRLTAASD